MTTGAVLVQDALAKRFVTAPNEEPDADQLAFGLRWLNRMLESWGAEKPMLYTITEETFTLTAGTASYSTSELADGRPASVDYLFNRLSNVDYPCKLVDNQTYADVQYKPVNAVPSICYYNDGYPNGTFNFYPRPYASFECHVYCLRVLTGTITSTTNVALPPGYEKAIVDSLAVYYPFAVPATPDMKKDADNARKLLMRANYVPLISRIGIDKDYSINNDFPFSGF
ncbi:MAG: hypothetical protein E6R03_07305 [Hyphomicrobiaceae bacterium]|nr:MAG: hypothetical protein E6R03_07305 [Hyphomicrobiaceae bacterium]